MDEQAFPRVRLIAISQPVIPEAKTANELLAYCARVSNPANQDNRPTAPKLLRYLVRNAEWSPFEMASMTLEIVTTRDIARQVLRHRSFAFQEFSQRYAAVSRESVLRPARMQDAKNRQASTPTDDQELARWWYEQQCNIGAEALTVYAEALDRGIAREVARSVLPEGMTPSVLYMAGTVRSWIHYVQLRRQDGTQAEHRAVAMKCSAILADQFPVLREVLA